MNTDRNINLLFLIKLAKWLMLYMPVSFLFYEENNFGIQEYLILHAVYSGVIAFLEVPSGYIADVWGRKPAIILGTLMGSIGFGMYSISYSLTGFLIAEILLGIGQSLLSGADTALLYDTLLQKNKEEKYLKVEGRITAVGNFAEAFAGIFVSLVILSSFRGYFILQTGLAFAAFIASLFLIEPKIKNNKTRNHGFQDIINIVVTTFSKEKKLRNYIVFSAAIGFGSLAMAWITQPIFFEIGLKKSLFGIAWVILNLFVALGSLSSNFMNKVLGIKGAIVFMTLTLPIGFILVGLDLSMTAFIPLALLYFIRGTAHPILKKYINMHTSSEQRATIFSLRSLLIRLMFFAIGPILGFLSEKISLSHALYLCSVSVLIPAVIFMFLLITGKKSRM